MQSKASWINKEILIQSFRSVGWVSIIYLVGLLLTIPLQILMDWSYRKDELEQNMQVEATNLNYYDNVFQIGIGIQLIMLVAIPVLLGIFLYRFLQVKQASDFMHSLPLKRTNLYTQYFLIGALFLVIPLFVTAVVLVIIHGALDLEQYYALKDVASWFGISIVYLLLMFSGTVMIGTISGLSAVQGVLTFIMFLFPAGILSLIYLNAKYYFYGYDAEWYFNNELENYSPITTIPVLHDGSFSSVQMWTYIVLTIVFFTIGLLCYQYRKLESVSQPLVFKSLKPIFKYGVTFCFMLLGGIYFAELQYHGSFPWLIVGYVIGSFIGYLVAEMVLHKTWRVFTHLKGYALYVVAAGILVAALQFDVTGYERRVPEMEDVKSAYIGEVTYGYMQDNFDQPDFGGGSILTTPENIEEIRELHKRLIEQKGESQRYSNYNHIYLAYELENGKEITRHYKVQMNDDMTKALKPIYESDEFKLKTNRILSVNPEDVIQIRIMPDHPVSINAQLKDPKVVIKAIEALQKDTLNTPYEGWTNWHDHEADIAIHLDNGDDFHMNLTSNYTSFKEVLREAGVLEDIQVGSEDVNYAVVIQAEGMNNLHRLSAEEIIDLENSIMVKDAEKIDKILDSSKSYNPGSPYVVMYMYSNWEVDFGTLEDNNLPDFVKEHFE
ncbi:DUF6449 domain-containing protein [Pseudalkalibacillus sp. Hm43]|uniref:DUF6449 domain-containing protein n=1 Tax=Pseudalkalibacillus sp. Hm43 TaxID=3450742 RepID=UPI003F42C95F